ncbi:MAG TPA: methionyl-tRNA formyltransferase [Pyrinomonadaceae bacterium]|nr:methionyl-tRNA formyltransferase [Pyrinomonadaceae bacterium]
MKIVFMGTPHAAVASLARIMDDGHQVVAVYTQPDKPAGRGNKISFSPVKQFALDHDLPIFQPSKVRTPEALEEFRSHGADAAVVVAYGRILPESFLSAFAMGAINVHFSLLPKYRGAAPVNWAIVHGEKVSGVTTMQMDVGLDTGPILMQRAAEIDENETAPELMQKLSVLGADLLSETLSDFETIAPKTQNELEASMAPIMKKEDGLISWMLNARDISNRVRGFQPFPTAFTFFRGKKLTVWSSIVVESAHELLRPGEIIEASGDRLLIFCGGDSVLQINELQLEGKRRVSSRDFLNGVRPEIGEVFGS